MKKANRGMMFSRLLIFACTAVLALQFAHQNTSAQDAVPRLINYQGRLTDAAGQALPDGSYRVRIEIFPEAVAGDQLIWGAEYNVATVLGQFNVVLGATGGTPVMGAAVNDIGFAFGASMRFMQTTILTNGTTWTQPRVLLPRQQILAAPFALQAQSALHGVPTGMVVPWAGSGVGLAPAPEGWLLANGQTIGNTNSGADLAVSLARNLYRLLWSSTSNADLPIQSPTGELTIRGADADSDFDSGKRMPIPDLRGRTVVGTGQGQGLDGGGRPFTTRVHASTFGEERHALSVPELAPHTHGVTDPGHTHSYVRVLNSGTTFGDNSSNQSFQNTQTGSSTTGITIKSTGGGQPFNVMQPSLALNYLIKL